MPKKQSPNGSLPPIKWTGVDPVWDLAKYCSDHGLVFLPSHPEPFVDSRALAVMYGMSPGSFRVRATGGLRRIRLAGATAFRLSEVAEKLTADPKTTNLTPAT